MYLEKSDFWLSLRLEVSGNRKSKIKNRMKRFLFTLLCLFAGYVAYGQDLIVTVSGDSLNCSITEVRNEAIFFRYDAAGSILSMPKSQVASYKYDFYKRSRNTSAVSVSMRGRSELSVYVGGGVSNLIYEAEAGSRSPGVGGLFGVGYTWFVSGRWGIVTGLEVSLYHSEYNANMGHTNTYWATSGIGSIENDFLFMYQYQDYSEKQSTLFLQIPAMAQFQTGRFFASGGIKVGIPISTRFDFTSTNLITSGDSFFNDPNKGLKNFGAISDSGNFGVGIQYAGALETGGQWFLGKRMNLYAGVWLDYSLNNISEVRTAGNKEELVEYNSEVPGYLKYNSILHTGGKFHALSAGVKVKLSFSL